MAIKTDVISKLIPLVNLIDTRNRMDGVAALNELWGVPSPNEERKENRFGKNLSHGLKAQAAS